MSDNAATSGGAAGPSELIRAEDTATDTNTGVSGALLPIGKVEVGRRGQDLGSASIDTPLDTFDARTAGVITGNLEEIRSMLAGIYQVLALNGARLRLAPCQSATTQSITVGTSVIAGLQASGVRRRVIVQNVGLYPIYVGLGIIPSTSFYSFALAPCANYAGDGSGQTYVDDLWAGSVSFICTQASGAVNVTELQ